MGNWKLFFGITAIFAVTATAAIPRPRFGGSPPPDVFNWLPSEAKEKIKSIHEDHSLRWEERKKMIDEIFDSLPQEVMDKMPLPPGFEKLPQDIQEKAKSINSDKTIKWGEKREKIREIIKSLPEEQQRLIPFPRFGGFIPPFGPRGLPPLPPPGFKEVLPSEVYQKLVEIHQNKELSQKEKKSKIDETMKGVPSEVLQKLPLPPFLENLPSDVQVKAREILTNFSNNFDTRHQNLHEFIETLPEELKKLIPHPPRFGGFGPFGPRHHRGFPPHPPPEFKEILGEEMYQKLDQIHQEKGLLRGERFKKIDQFMSTLPKETLEKLPLPPPFRQLPAEAQQKIREIMNDFSIDFKIRMEKVREFIKTLPEDQQKLVPPPPPFFGHGGHGHRHGFPQGPPPDFKDIIPSEKWDELVAIHKNENLSWDEKKKQLNDVMNSLPTETLMKLPLPPHLRKLSEENQQIIRQFFADKTLTFDEKFRMTKEFIKTLPDSERKLARPFPPPGFENLPSDAKAKIDAIFDNENLGHHERFEKVREVIDSLPSEIRAKLPPPPPPFH